MLLASRSRQQCCDYDVSHFVPHSIIGVRDSSSFPDSAISRDATLDRELDLTYLESKFVCEKSWLRTLVEDWSRKSDRDHSENEEPN